MGVLKVRVNGAWEEVTPGIPNEVVVDPTDPYITDPLSTAELWFDPDEVRPPTLEEEVFVGTEDPDVIAPLNKVDLWYDPDDNTTSAQSLDDLSDVDVTGASKVDGEVLTWDEAAQLWKSYPPTVDLRPLVRAHHVYGPPTTSGWTWTLAAGDYLCQFQCSCVASVAGIRYANLNMDGVQVAQSKHWFNELSVHHQMNQGVSVITIPVDGDYVFDITMSASAAMDANDFGHVTLIPATTGAF